MKKSIFAVIIIAVFFAANALQAYAGGDETTVTIPSIVCNTCMKNITSALKKLDGIENVSVDLKGKTVTVTYDDTKTNIEAVENAISSAGYDANDKKADPVAYEKLYDCCKIGGH